MKKTITPILLTIFFIAVTVAIIYWGKGYRYDLDKKSLGSRGLLVASSQPNGAQVFINGKLTTATNSTLTLDPNWYDVRIEKEGYSKWEKKLRVQGEVVAKTDTILFPINPSLSPITITGAANPLLSPDSNKILFTVSKSNNYNTTIDGAGVYILDLVDRPLGSTRNARQIAKDTPFLSFDNAVFTWDPTSKKILTKVDNRYFLLDASLLNTNPQDVTPILTTILTEWEKTNETLETERRTVLKPELTRIIETAIKTLAWSPDESKILYEATSSVTLPNIINPPLIGTNPTQEEREITPGKIYVYDIKEDKNFYIMDKNQLYPAVSPTPVAQKTKPTPSIIGSIIGNSVAFPLQWFPTSSHLLLTEKDKISIMDYDATNKITLYAGPFMGDFVAPWPNGSKIVILTTLNPQPDAKPNLYAINIR